MFCFNCGQDIGSGMAFCPRCGAPQKAANAPASPAPGVQQAAPPPVQPAAPKAKKKRGAKGLVIGIVIALILIAAAVLAFVLWGGEEDDRDSGRASASDRDDRDDREDKEDKEDKDGDTPTLEQILISEAVHSAQQMGRLADSWEYIEALGAPAECAEYIKELSAFDSSPSAVMINNSLSVPEEMVSAYYMVGENQLAMCAQLPAALNGHYGGNTILAAYSMISTSHMVCLPEELEEPAAVLVCYEVCREEALVLFLPADGKLTQVSCWPISGRVFEGMDLYDWLEMTYVSEKKVEIAVNAAEGTSLAASRSWGKADGTWCSGIADGVLERVGSCDPEDVRYFTDDPDVYFRVEECVYAARQGAVGEAEVYTFDAAALGELFGFPAHLIKDYRDVLLPQLGRAVANAMVNPYGVNTVVANSVLTRLASGQQGEAQRLPMDFDTGKIYVVLQELVDGRVAVTVLFDAGNNILGMSFCILPDYQVLFDLWDGAFQMSERLR